MAYVEYIIFGYSHWWALGSLWLDKTEFFEMMTLEINWPRQVLIVNNKQSSVLPA